MPGMPPESNCGERCEKPAVKKKHGRAVLRCREMAVVCFRLQLRCLMWGLRELKVGSQVLEWIAEGGDRDCSSPEMWVME
ncbi:hypothetical protein DCAR_0205275 [Daucus carota subsp. sativus]|uniref:Uncharacterized protein n=1 Tax=Daucus carota subsp. sativus TaxID=79200 RepID=A0A175YD24_DAUCS|nr:hypothetical protein DCAR_0205275 [Daucus carota subsp. sativus]